MKISLFCGLALTTAPVWAQTPVEQPMGNAAPPLRAPTMATKTVFIAGLKEPQGMALDRNGNLYVCDYGAGEILKFSREGKALGTLATGLKGPSQILARMANNQFNSQFLVTESGANRVIAIATGTAALLPGNRKVERIRQRGGEIKNPVGLTDATAFAYDHFALISRMDSQVYLSVSDPKYTFGPDSDPHSYADITSWKPLYTAPKVEGKYPIFRCLTSYGGTFFVTEETEGAVWMLSGSGKIAKFAEGLGAPSGISFGFYYVLDDRNRVVGSKTLYVCDESNGGRLLELDNEGKPTVIATELGHPNSIVFLDAKTALVSNRDGNVWKIALP